VSKPLPIAVTVNGDEVNLLVEPRLSLVDMVRHTLALTGSHVGCETGSCGACLMLLDGTVVHGCLTLAVQANGRDVTTIEGLTEAGEIADLQEAFHAHNALQCGYCTPGMLMTARALLGSRVLPSRDEIREALSGNFCRCTGYEAIVDAIEDTARRRQALGRTGNGHVADAR
jgi:aerobic carbon-monoxide dehydrogenase small subunit